MAYAILVLKNILYDLTSLFKKMQKGELMEDTISIRVSTLLKDRKFIVTNKIKF